MNIFSRWNRIKKRVLGSGYLEVDGYVVIGGSTWRKMLADSDHSHKRIALLEAEIGRDLVPDTSKEEFLRQRLDTALVAADTARLQMLRWHVATLNGVDIYVHADDSEVAASLWSKAGIQC